MGHRLLRTIRRRITAAITQVACGAAPHVPARMIDMAEWIVGRTGPISPVLAALARRNMTNAGVYSRAALRDYFRQAALHLSNGVRIFHFRRKPDAIRRIAGREIELDASVLSAAESIQRTGGLLVPPHCTNFLISLVKLREVLPISIYLRWSRDPRKLALKRAWCEAAGLDVIIEPPDAANPVGSAMICAEAIRAGRILAITPDIAQRPEVGTPVHLLGRRAFLPVGPGSLAMLCEVPLIPLFARDGDDCQVVYAEPPIRVAALSRAEGGRRESIRRAMQTWADGFTRFVTACPHRWFLWADSRWTRVFDGDPAYAGSSVEPRDVEGG